MINIILLSGACFSGKTHIKKAWLAYKNNDFKWFGGAFAKALKDEMHELGLIDKKKLSDNNYKNSVRKLMQDYGQKKRAWCKDYWALKLHEAIGDDLHC